MRNCLLWSPNNSHKSSAVAEMGDRLATIDMGQKLGDVPLLGDRRRSEAEATAGHKH